MKLTKNNEKNQYTKKNMFCDGCIISYGYKNPTDALIVITCCLLYVVDKMPTI